MADSNPMVLRYNPREFGARPVPMPAPPWQMDSAEPLRATPAPSAPSARDIHIRRIRRIEAEYATLPEKAIDSPHIRGEFLGRRDKVAEKSGPREADYCFAVLACAISWVHNRRRIVTNP